MMLSTIRSVSNSLAARFRTECSRWQPVHDDACFARAYECGSGPHADGRAARKEDFLKSQRPLVVVGEVGTGP